MSIKIIPEVDYLTQTEGDAAYAPIAKGVTNGDSHDHQGGDGGQVDHGGLGGLADDDHSQYHNDTRGDARYTLHAHTHAGTTNGPKLAQANTHESPDTDTATTAIHHTLGTGANQAAAGNHTHSGLVTNGDSHDHSGGDGAQIAYSSLSGLPPIQMALSFHSHINASVTLTDQASAHGWLSGSSRNIFFVDLTGYSSIKLQARILTSSGSANTPKIYLLYRTTYSAAEGDWTLDVGTSAVECSLASTGIVDSGWIALAAGAKAEVYLGGFQSGGDGAADPVLGRVTAFVKV